MAELKHRKDLAAKLEELDHAMVIPMTADTLSRHYAKLSRHCKGQEAIRFAERAVHLLRRVLRSADQGYETRLLKKHLNEAEALLEQLRRIG